VEAGALVCEGGEVAVLCESGATEAELGEPEAEAEGTAEPETALWEALEAVTLWLAADAEPEMAEPDWDAGEPGPNIGTVEAPAGRTVANVRSAFWPGKVSSGKVNPSVVQDVVKTSTYSCAVE